MVCCSDIPAGALSAQISPSQTINPVCLLVVNLTAFPPQLNMKTQATVPYPGFRNFPDAQGYRPIVTPAQPVVTDLLCISNPHPRQILIIYGVYDGSFLMLKKMSSISMKDTFKT